MAYTPPQVIYVVFFTPPSGRVEMIKTTTDKVDRDSAIKHLNFVPHSGRVWYEVYALTPR